MSSLNCFCGLEVFILFRRFLMKELNQFELKQVAGGNGIAEDIGWALGRGSRWLWNQEWFRGLAGGGCRWCPVIQE